MRLYECRRRGWSRVVWVSEDPCFFDDDGCRAGSACVRVLPHGAREVSSGRCRSECVSEMQVVLHREVPEDEEFRRQWNGLVEAMERPEVFYTWEWARAVARGYCASLRPLV